MAWHHWGQRSEASRERILGQLRGMVAELRALRPPTPGSLGVAKTWTAGPSTTPACLRSSPGARFAAQADFHRELANGLDLEAEYKASPQDLGELLEFYRQPSGAPVFTHGDLSSLNILVRGDGVVGTGRQQVGSRRIRNIRRRGLLILRIPFGSKRWISSSRPCHTNSGWRASAANISVHSEGNRALLALRSDHGGHKRKPRY